MSNSSEVRVLKYAPLSSEMKRAIPMPTGAMKVTFDFSAARNKTLRTNMNVKNISIKKPWATLVSSDNVVTTRRGPGNIADANPAATIPPRNCGKKSARPRNHGKAPDKQSPNVTWRTRMLVVSSAQNSRWSYRGVEEAATYPIENPGVDHQRHAKGESNVREAIWVVDSIVAICDLGAAKGEPKEQNGSHEFACHRDKMLPESVFVGWSGRPFFASPQAKSRRSSTI